MLSSFDTQGFMANFNNAKTAKTNRLVGEDIQGGNLQEAANTAFSRGANNMGMQLQQAFQKQKASVDKEQQAQMDAMAKKMGGLASALSKVPATQRLQVIQNVPQFQQAFGSMGIDPTQITNEHLSDDTLISIQGMSQGASDFNSDTLARDKFGEDQRSALVSEDQSQQTIDNTLANNQADNSLNSRKQDFVEGGQHDLNVARLDEAKRSNRASEGINTVKNEIAQIKAAADGGGKKPELTDVLKIRDKVESQNKVFEAAQRQFLTMEKLKGDATGASDVALGFAFFKTIDPTSTVREGEFASAAGALGVGARIQGMLQRLDDGQKFTPQLREDLVSAARKAYEEQKKDITALNQRTGEFSERYGIPAGDVSRDPIRANEQSFSDGQTATNPSTGEKMVFTNGQWVPQ